MANELSFSLDQISDVTISYDDESITFFTSENDTLIIKEYMTSVKKNYYAKVKQDSNFIHISEGAKPFLKKDFLRYVNVYLPSTYRQKLTVTTSGGNIDMSGIALKLSELRIDSTSGNIQITNANATEMYFSSTHGSLNLDKIAASNIRLETTSGNITCNKATGVINYSSTAGNAEFTSTVGSGKFKNNNSGKLSINYTEVRDNLFIYNKNDSIELTLPNSLEFNFKATTKNGSVSTSFPESITHNNDTFTGIIGNEPTVNVTTETKNGNIKVSY